VCVYGGRDHRENFWIDAGGLRRRRIRSRTRGGPGNINGRGQHGLGEPSMDYPGHKAHREDQDRQEHDDRAHAVDHQRKALRRKRWCHDHSPFDEP